MVTEADVAAADDVRRSDLAKPLQVPELRLPCGQIERRVQPDVGSTITAGKVFGTIESVKAVSELFSPVSGEVVAVNGDLANHPEKVNNEPHATWMIRLKASAPDESSALLDAAAYQDLIK